MVEVNDQIDVVEKQAKDIEHIDRRMDLFDQRMDNIDSIVTAVAERIMNQLVTLSISCPHCSKDIEIAIIGNQKAKR